MNALLTVRQVAKYLGLSESWVRNMVDANKIPHARLGRSIRFRQEDIDNWIDSNLAGPSGLIGGEK